MKEKIAIMKESVNQDFASAKSLKELFDAKVKYLGKNGQLTELMKGMKDIPKEERPAFGKIVNELRDEIDAVYAKFEEVLKNQERLKQFEDESIDITLPGKPSEVGTLHPITLGTRNIFLS